MSKHQRFSISRSMSVRLISFLLLICLPAGLLAGVTGKIAGKVVSAETGDPLPGANVVIAGTSLGASTDMEGDYYVINLRPGTYSVSASMMGYQSVITQNVKVIVDHTVTVDFSLPTTVLEGSEVVVTADREVVIMDRSASEISISSDDISNVPAVRDVGDYLNLEAGIEDGIIRGGGMDQTALMIDGMAIIDNRSNEPLMMLNLSSVDHINIIKGGFNAEYGNIRSGLINVTTKEGSVNGYNGSIDIQLDPAQQKHGGYSLYDPNNYYIKPFLDRVISMMGTSQGNEAGLWTDEELESYPTFVGWNEISADLMTDGDESNDMTAQEARELFKWYHQLEGSEEHGQKKGEYAHKPDYNIDVGIGGPVPLIGKIFGGMTFYLSHHDKSEMFGLPASQDYYHESNTHLSLTVHPTSKTKLKLEALYGEINTVAYSPEGSGNNWYLTSGWDIFNSYLVTSDAYAEGGGSALYWRDALNPFNIYRSMLGISFDHVLSPSTFYNLRISHVNIKNACFGPRALRDTSTVHTFGNFAVDEAPYGFAISTNYTPSGDKMVFASLGSVARDESQVNSLNVKFDLTSQVTKRHQLKTGFELNYDDLQTHYWSQFDYAPKNNYVRKYRAFPLRLGAYVQDKIEIKGLIANLGLRMDVNEPNQDWYSVDQYSKYLSVNYKDDFTDLAPTEPAKGHVKLSPRLGVSHPITESAKLYFNYGHFFSMPSSFDMYQIGYGTAYQGIDYLGNPSADIPKTVAYELGVEYDLSNMILLHFSGYYKDVSDQIGYVGYTSIDGSVSYTTTENNNYEDIRGFEFRIQKRFGRIFTGWFNYNYMVQTWGYHGREWNYEDIRDQLRYGHQNPKQEKPLARPYWRANLTATSPKAFGPTLFGRRPLGQLQANVLLGWKAGEYFTWDPLNTHELENNLQWKGEWTADLRLAKSVAMNSGSLMFFMEITNFLGLEYLSIQGFADGDDWRKYLESLHLPMYKDEEYESQEKFTGGKDRVGDLDKDYINGPNRKFLTDLNPRRISLGLKFNF